MDIDSGNDLADASTLEATEVDNGHGHEFERLSQGITIRFDALALGQIRYLAHQKGIGPTTLARIWVMERLHEEQGDGSLRTNGKIASEETHR